MNLQQAIDYLRMSIEAYRQKRKRTFNDRDLEAILIVIAEVHRKDRL